MAYAAAISIRSLKLFNESSDEMAKIHCPESYIQHLDQISFSIQNFDFQETGPEGKYLEKEIRDALWRAEDIIELYMLNHILSPEDNNGSSGDISQASSFSKDLLEVIQEIESIKERMDKFADELKHAKENSIVPVSGFVIASTDDFPPKHKKKMVGLDDDLRFMKDLIMGDKTKLRCLAQLVIYGMGGIGKTSLALSIYNDLDIRRHFSIGAWIKMSPEHSVRNILLNLVHSMEFFDNGMMMRDDVNCIVIQEMDDGELASFIRAKFMLKRYLLVVDCLCDLNLNSWDYLKTILPNSNNGSLVLLVSRMRMDLSDLKKRSLDASESWDLLQQQVFGDEPCSNLALEKIGKRIAKNCQGLPLAIITVGEHLAKKEKTVEYWNKVAESGNSIAYAADGARMFEQLGLSYNQMPQPLRLIFLYMGVFGEGREISIIELQRLWDAEVLTHLVEFESVENLNSEPFKYYFDRDLIIDDYKNNTEMWAWSLHHALWHFCCNQAKEEEFFYALDKDSNYEEDSSINSSRLRRLVIRKTVLFGINEFVQKDLEEKELSFSIRSMLFTGPYHPYPLTKIMWSSYKMLRVLNACSIRFYEFPTEILCLKLLRYLALTLNGGDLPSGISKLRYLNTLIVRFHYIVRSCTGDPLYLPIEIWEMTQLCHLQVMGFDLPVPPHSDVLLPNLTTIMDASPHSCSKEVLERIPNLKILTISINLAPKGNSAPISLFDDSVPLKKLYSANFVINNPYFEVSNETQVITMPKRFSFSMKYLKQLSLSGCGFSWENIEPISQLCFLLMLELRCNAFRGPKWEITSNGFARLRYLLLENLDLIYWTTGSGDHFFPSIWSVFIKKCHKLEQLPCKFKHCRDLGTIEVVDSSHAAEKWAQSMYMEQDQTYRLGIRFASQRGESVIPRGPLHANPRVGARRLSRSRVLSLFFLLFCFAFLLLFFGVFLCVKQRIMTGGHDKSSKV